MSKEHIYKIKIYYEDTDVGGVVYYANYLKFTERARTEMIYDLLKMSHTDLKDKFDIILVVSGFKAKYLKPAKFEQEIRVFSSIIRKSPVRLTIKQDIKFENEILFTSEVEIAVVKKDGNIQKIPGILLSKIN
jgi:acyl-CoA thioester hydrolase